MAAPTYASDLQDIIVDPTSTTGWTAIGTGGAGLATSGESDYFVQGTTCMSKGAWTNAIKGMIYNYGSGITVTNTDDAFWIWVTHHTPGSLDTETNGGIRAIIGSGSGAYNHYYIRGANTITYGAPWIMAIVDPAAVSADTSTGSPSGTLQYFGGLANLPTTAGPTKGSPFGIDAMRWGRTFTCTNGDLGNGYATFAGAVAYNDNINRVYGQIQQGDGVYLARGRFRIGSSGTSCDFRDSNRNILFDRLTKVASTFNEIEIVNASTRVDWTGITIAQLTGSPQTVTYVRFVATNDADINIDSCQFVDMGTFTFQSNSTIVGSTFRRCKTITLGGGSLTDCVISNSTEAQSVSASTIDNITGCTFVSDGGNHAVDLGTVSSTTSMTWNNTLTNYAVSDGSTGNEAIKVSVASSQTLTINVSSGASTPSIYNTGAGTVVVSAGSVSATLTVTNVAGTAISGANVLVKANTGGSLPVNATVTISNSGTTATVSHTGHGMITGDKVLIRFLSDTGKIAANEGVFSITKLTNDSYSYTMGSSPGSSPSGTIYATYVLLNGTTNGSGQITMSRAFGTNQPVIGWARKSTSSPFYKTGAVTGTVDTGSGAQLSAILISDE